MVLDHPTGGGSQGTAIVERGPILDRNGRILAVETREYSVSAWMPSVKSKSRDAGLLAPILGMSRRSIVQRLSTHTGFVYIARKIPDPKSAKIRTLINDGKLTGINLEPSFARLYPNGDLAGHVIGYVGTDNQGLAGIEYSFNRVLSPSTRHATAGKQVFGDQVFLTLDENVQYEAERLAGEVYKKTRPRAIVLLVEQAKTGDILADVSYPEFDPNNFSRYSAKTREDYPISYVYEPGSVLKIFTISSFLQLGGITPKTKFYDNGYYVRKLPGLPTIRIHGLAPHEWEDAQLIIKWSSNVGAAYASNTVGRKPFYRMLRDFGFGSPTYIDLPGESIGILRPVSEWNAWTKPSMSFGQGIGVTAMQIVAAATALTNGGVLLKPHIVSKIVAPDGRVVQRFPREPLRRVISSKVAHEMLSYMETGTEPGAWAYGARIQGVPVSAKTGTSNVFDTKTGHYSKTDYVASSISIFPTNHPRFIVYAAIIDPRGPDYWGSGIAVPLVQKVATFLTSYYSVPRTTDTVVNGPRTVSVPRALPVSVGKKLPDLLGLSKRQILPLLHDAALRVQIRGQGWVVKQSPSPGTTIRKGMAVTVELK